MSEAGVYADGCLADELAAALGPRLQDALGHPTRREILRLLNAKETPCGFTEILGKLHPIASAEINYHVQVLQAAGSIVVEGTRPAIGGRDLLYRSALAEDPMALAVLEATEQPDGRPRKRVKRSKSSSLLTMFRVPRPGPTIRLGGQKRRPRR